MRTLYSIDGGRGKDCSSKPWKASLSAEAKNDVQLHSYFGWLVRMSAPVEFTFVRLHTLVWARRLVFFLLKGAALSGALRGERERNRTRARIHRTGTFDWQLANCHVDNRCTDGGRPAPQTHAAPIDTCWGFDWQTAIPFWCFVAPCPTRQLPSSLPRITKHHNLRFESIPKHFSPVHSRSWIELYKSIPLIDHITFPPILTNLFNEHLEWSTDSSTKISQPKSLNEISQWSHKLPKWSSLSELDVLVAQSNFNTNRINVEILIEFW